MTVDRDLLNKAWGLLDQERLVRTCCDLVSIPSPTGSEKGMAEYIIERYRKLGLQVVPQQVEDGRPNAIAILEGNGTGPTLMLCGHMDTSYVGNEPGMPDLPYYKPRGYVEDGWICGLGSNNMKGALAAYLEAVEVVKALGIELKGDVTVACVVGEIEKSQVDQYQGALYRGGSIGAWYAVTHGALADFAVVGEPTTLAIMRAHGGYVYTKITLKGLPAHSIYGDPSKNTIHNMFKVGRAIEEWGADYAQRASYLGMPARVTLSAIEGGWPYRGSRVPVQCSLYVDTRLLPGQSPLQVKREIKAVLKRLVAGDRDLASLGLEQLVYMSQSGSECSPDEFIFKTTRSAHISVFGEEPRVIAQAGYSDANELVHRGIPSLNYGPSGRTRSRAGAPAIEYGWDPLAGEQQNIDDLVSCTKVYISLILDVCNRTREEIATGR